LRGYLGEQLRGQPFGAGKHLGKDAIEAIVVALVLNETGARQVVEILRRQLRDARLQGLEEHQELGGGHRHAGAAQLKEELHQHGGSALSAPGDA
jgi:nanoRNase/pAp phosphatase (c-di-AMP/oligoRNAs hydrolase)